ncbi:YegP family protein [Actinokineospora globicatena]
MRRLMLTHLYTNCLSPPATRGHPDRVSEEHGHPRRSLPPHTPDHGRSGRSHRPGSPFLKASNGEVVTASEAHESKQAALNGVKAVQSTAPTASVDDRT